MHMDESKTKTVNIRVRGETWVIPRRRMTPDLESALRLIAGAEGELGVSVLRLMGYDEIDSLLDLFSDLDFHITR